MADEPEAVAVETPEPVTEPTETVEAPAKTHPLEPGGVRFNEVYAEKKALEREVAVLREQLARPTAPEKPATPPQQFYTAQQLQDAVDAGKISAAVMADQLAWQRAQQAREEVRKETLASSRRENALQDVNAYVSKIPALNNPASPEFTRVAAQARAIATDMGRDPFDPAVLRDPVIQRLALKAEFGDHAKILKAEANREFDRKHADTYVETGSGVGRQPATKDPFKNVPADLKAHWDRLGYTEKQRLEELPYVKMR